MVMLPEVEKLLVVQNRDQRIRAIDAELRAVPLERKSLEERMAREKLAAETLKAKVRGLEIERKKLEVDVKAKEDSIARFRGQQQQTRKNEEYQALAHEIERFSNDITKIEDRELEIMEAVETAQAGLKKAEAEFAADKVRIEAQLNDLDAKSAALKQQAEALLEERKSLAGAIDEDLFDRYVRLLKSKGDSAIVGMEREICTGCHMKVTTQTAHKVRSAREVVSCDYCGRILFPAD